MPLAFFNTSCRETIEPDPHNVFRFCRLGEDTKTFAQKFSNREIDWSPKSRFADPHVTDSGKRERAQLLAIKVECEQVPKVFNATKMIRLHITWFEMVSFGLLVFESDF